MDGLKDVEAVGDMETLLITSNYLALLGRKRGHVDFVRKWAQHTIVLAQKAENEIYRTSALGSLAWAEHRCNNNAQAQIYLEEALALQKNVPSAFRFMTSGPAMAVEIDGGNWNVAVEHAKELIDPSQRDMPSDVRTKVEQAIKSWEEGKVEATSSLFLNCIELMRQKQMGFV
jgi:hypothetical protein